MKRSKKKEYTKHIPFYRNLLNGITGIVLKLGRIHVHISDTDKIPKDRKLLFVSNHRSNFDPIITWYCLKEWRIAFLSKASLFKLPFFGWLIRRNCFIAIDRDNPKNAMVSILKASALLVKQEVSIGVYPEGTRNKDGNMLPFHNGVFKVAKKSASPIAILAIEGTEKIVSNYPFRKTDVYLKVLDIISEEEVHKSKTSEIGEIVKNKINREINNGKSD